MVENEVNDGAESTLESLVCEGLCEVHKGEVIPVIIRGGGWDAVKFNYCQEAIAEDERRGFVVKQNR